MRIASPLRRGAADRLAYIDAVLEAAYGTPEGDLGNKFDPLDEAIYIILSFQTDLARFSSTWSQLRAAFPTWDAVERAPALAVARVLREGGLYRQKTRTIRRLLAEVRHVAGRLSLDHLRTINDEDAERLLTRLPGLSWKAARCVLLYSLGREVLPIDSNTFRILKRTGILSHRAVYRRRTLHDAIQAAVLPPRRRALHVNLVVHGQRTCLPRDPQCGQCPLFVDCPKVGLSARSRRPLQAFHATSVEGRGAVARGSAER
jgi:endonuclease III